MRPLVALLLLFSVGCNRYHMYKKAGQSMVGAFQTQAAGTDAPRPRGIDGEEATLIIHEQKQGFSQDDDTNPAAVQSGAANAKPSAIPFQAR